MSTKRKRELRKKLFDSQGGLCHWCKQPMIWNEGPPDGKVGKKDATLDHLYERGHPNRVSNGDYKNVAAHSKCNNMRSNKSEKEFQNRIKKMQKFKVKIEELIS